MEEIKNNFCLIPPSVWKHPELSLMEKCLLGRINSLSSEKGYCYAGNNYLAEELGYKTPKALSNALSKLVEKGFLIREVSRNKSQEVEGRKLKINWIGIELIYQSKVGSGEDTPLHQMMDTSPSNDGYPLHQKVEYRIDGREENRKDIYINENLLDDLPITKELEVEKKKKGRKKVEPHLLTEEEEKWLNNLDEETITKLVSVYEISREELKNFASGMVFQIKSKGYMYCDIKATLRTWLDRKFKKKEKLLRYQDDPQEFMLRLEVRNQMLLDETMGIKKTEQEYIAMLEDLRKKGLPKYEL